MASLWHIKEFMQMLFFPRAKYKNKNESQENEGRVLLSV